MRGVGVDVVDIDRFSAALARRPSIVDRVFGPGERESAHGPMPPHRLAARFAAKEATMKALGVGLGAIDLHDVGVASDPGGRPRLVVAGRAAALAAARGVTHWHVSLSHDRRSAVAVVIAE